MRCKTSLVNLGSKSIAFTVYTNCSGRVAPVPPHLLLGASLDVPVQPQLAPGPALRRQAVPGVQVVQVLLRLPEGRHDVHDSERAHAGTKRGTD